MGPFSAISHGMSIAPVAAGASRIQRNIIGKHFAGKRIIGLPQS